MREMHTPNAEEVTLALGQALYRLRRAAGLSQVDLSKALNVDQTAVSRWERGKDVFPAPLIPQIERVLDVPRGSLWAAAGLNKLDSVEGAIYADDRLSPNDKRSLIAVYSALVSKPGNDGGGGGSGIRGR